MTIEMDDVPDTSADDDLRWQSTGDRIQDHAASITTARMARRLPQLIGRALSLAWRVDHWSVVVLLACQAVSAASGAVGLLATTNGIASLVASGHISERVWAALPAVGMVAGASGLRATLGIVIENISVRLAPRISREAELMLLHAALDAELSAYDHPGYTESWDAADLGSERAKNLLAEAQQLMAAVASLISAAGVLTVLHPVLPPLLVAVALPEGFASVRSARIYYLNMLATLDQRRVLNLLRWNMVDKDVAAQVRAGTMKPFLLAKYRRAGDKIDVATDQAARLVAKTSMLGALVTGVGACATWGAVALLASTGQMSVASAGGAVFALSSASSALKGIVGYGADLFRTGLYLDDWSSFLEEAGGHRMRRGSLPAPAPEVVRVEQVSYQYPAAIRDSLTDVTLEVKRGEVLALVGENGSGKTTLSKLLAGLYLPTHGQVLWDGVDTRELDHDAMWAQVAVVPQDYAQWPMSALENITLGQPVPGRDRFERAAQLSGADEVIASLSKGADTLLARQWWGGEELSGGQWQRIAMARAFYRPAGLLVLDEPTSALDARAEHRVFANLRELANDRAVVLVTHRLANVAVADRIVVLKHGRVIQEGTFAKLASEDGLFRELWGLQNKRGVVRQRREED